MLREKLFLNDLSFSTDNTVDCHSWRATYKANRVKETGHSCK